MKKYVKPSVAKVNFDFTDRVAASMCSDTAEAGRHLATHTGDWQTGVAFNDGCMPVGNNQVRVAGNIITFN